jgi:hypothetical protein
MTEKTRKWAKSKVNVDQVNQNTKNAQQFVELTEKYKTLGTQIEAKIDALFNLLGTHFMSFDPNLTTQQELEKSGQKEQIKELLMKSIILKGLDFKSIMTTDLEEYAKTLLHENYQAIVLVASEQDFFAKKGNSDKWPRSEVATKEIKAQLKLEPTYTRFEKAQTLVKLKDLNAGYIDEQLLHHKLTAVELITTYLKSVKDSVEKLDLCNSDQLKAALNALKDPADIKVLEEWV